ncbi:MAG: haloacid dehalogenase-like hydrolase, partial [Clostridia bacterium]|nr:haloacid dehalogenase-like hydrolase [Clostridia bacterium]
MRKKPTIAFMYDFDKTLCDQDMQDYAFIPNLNMSSEEFWGETEAFRKKNYMEGILGYMYYMKHKCDEKGIPFTKEYLRSLGQNINFYKGVQNWFKRINQYGESIGVKIEHYVISSGIKDIIDGCSIKDEFKKIFACQYYFDEKGEAVWPKIAINYTQKTQYIFRISKGIYDETDNKKVNEKMTDRVVAYQNMIYFGDGITDIPCMTFVKKQGGISIAIYPKGKKNKVTGLLLDNRVNYICPADYQEGSELDSLIKCIIQEMQLSHTLMLKQKQQKTRETK